MNLDPANIAYCKSCECAMDVTMLAPFTNVQCPECGEHNRVKVDVGGYVLKKRQGVGGMSLVFGAVDKTLGRIVAIKILNEEYSMDKKRIQQFEQEARITAAMSHPHIVKVFTVGQAYDRFFIAMEMVAGDSLESKMRKHGALPENEVLSWAQQIADGLNAAHEAGLIHRDIKPGNILFDKEGHVKIVDFGLALVTQGGKAQADEIWATPYYVPPEALDIGEEDFRSDIYAMGASLFHALSGKPPFTTETRSTTELKEIKRKLPKLKEVAPWLHEETCAVIDKAMAFEMDDRFGSYQELIDALQYAETLVLNDGETPSVSSVKRAHQREGASSWKKYALAAAVIAIGGGITAMKMMPSPANTNPSDKPDVAAPLSGYESNAVSDVLSNRVSVEIVSARGSLLRKNYRDGARRYAELANDPNVSANTVCWASIQAANAYWLDGRSGDARGQLANTLRRYRGKDASLPSVARRMLKLIRRLTRFASIKESELPEIQEEADALAVFSAALKNWNSGAPEEAVKLFGRLDKLKFEPSPEMKFYQQISRDYLHDAALVAHLRDGFHPQSLAQIDARMQQILGIEGKLKTRGRVRFDLNEWKFQIKAHRQRLLRQEKERLARIAAENKQPKPPEVPKDADWESLYAEIKNDLLDAEFIKPAARLKLANFSDSETNARKENLSYLCGLADGYKATLRNTFTKEAITVSLKLKDGRTSSKITGATLEGLKVILEGKPTLLKWADIEPGSLVDLHSYNVRGNISQFEKNLRLEQAIAFAFLTGEKHKAKKGAKVLAETNPIFRNRWKECLRLLDQ